MSPLSSLAPPPPSLVSVCESSARLAGVIIASASPSLLANKANSRDLLTSTDPLAESAIKEEIARHFPDDVFLGEEGVAPGPESSAAALSSSLAAAKERGQHLWIADPLDGTTNFCSRLQLSAVSVAVADPDGELLASCIFDPYSGECFTASLGGGAFLNGERLLISSPTPDLGSALVGMGSPPGAESMTASLAVLPALMPKVRSIRMLGSAALMLAYVACGRLSAYWEWDLSSWDVAGGALIVEEAGGVMANLGGGEHTLSNRKILACDGEALKGLLAKVIKEAGVE
ncbi:hypothetical protein TeGR_g4132 [Tetraparma gracilis]|uniref:Inositol-1-monophosphatase n=1 Tax=Tetraparma gracilis TaxID=2962635 RepID=A0ABQ6N499_9STRA|nr:hypothetical protein TeGR_g4132 [Tetraparma gracilis]